MHRNGFEQCTDLVSFDSSKQFPVRYAIVEPQENLGIGVSMQDIPRFGLGSRSVADLLRRACIRVNLHRQAHADVDELVQYREASLKQRHFAEKFFLLGLDEIRKPRTGELPFGYHALVFG